MESKMNFSDIVEKIKQLMEEKGIEQVRNDSTIFRLYLAEYVRYNLTKGGFSQLLYNLKGEYLEEIEEMLIEVQARILLDYYLKALDICLEDIEEYNLFISKHYLEANSIKNKLHEVSIAYFAEKGEFEDELEKFVQQNYSRLTESIDRLMELK